MECKLCCKITISQIKCHICNNTFCSNSCLDSHFLLNHKSLIYPNNKIYEKPKIDRMSQGNIMTSYSISSPYITNGFILNEIIYDIKYNLKNFTPMLEYNSPKIIGIGSYGKVYLYKNITDKKLYAVKHLNKMILCKSIHTIKRIYDEIDIQSRIYHQNIVRLLYVKENDESIYLIMEYANNGSLFNYIRKKGSLNEEESFIFFCQIINAIYFLHKNDYIHRDIKPENILIFDNNECKLCDFGCCVELNGKQRSTFCGTTEYMSPEIVNKIEYSKEIDIWSLGILLYEMIHGYSPFNPNKDAFNAKEVIDKIKIHDIKFKLNVSRECKELICHLLDKNAKNRYKIEDIFNSDFIRKYEKMNYFFLKEKDLNNNIKRENIFNNTYRQCLDNPLLLSSLIENDDILNKTLFNNIKYNVSNKPKVKNKINNVIFNNVINRNNNNNNWIKDGVNKQLMSSQELNKKITIQINNDSLNISNDNYDNFNSSGIKKKVKVTKLNSKSFILKDEIRPNIYNVKKINNDIDLENEISFLNISYIKNQNNDEKNIIIKNNQSIKINEKGKNKIIESFSNKDINRKNNTKVKYQMNSNYLKIFPQTSREEKLKNKDNNDLILQIDKIKKKEFSTIKNKYYIKPKIPNDIQFPKDNSKTTEKQKQKVFHFKDCLNTKIKIPRRKILNSLHLENINLFNNIDLINNNDNEIPSIDSSNQLNVDYSQMNDIKKEFPFFNNIENNSHRLKNNQRLDAYLNDNSINTQINKNYIFNPKISINLPKFSFTEQKKNHNRNFNVKIKEIVEDFKEKIEPKIDLSKSQNLKKNKIFNNIKNTSFNKFFNSKEPDKFEIQNIINTSGLNNNEKMITKSKEHNTKTTKTLLTEYGFQSKIKDDIKNISPPKHRLNIKIKNTLSKSMSNTNEKLKIFNDYEKEANCNIENKKNNVKHKEINKMINLNLIKNNQYENFKAKDNNKSIKIINNFIKPISERTEYKKINDLSNSINNVINTIH